MPSKIRASSVASASSSSLDSQGRRKKGRRKKGAISGKAKKVSNRLYGHASAIKKRHDDKRELHHNAEMEYCSVNQVRESQILSLLTDFVRNVAAFNSAAVSNVALVAVLNQ